MKHLTSLDLVRPPRRAIDAHKGSAGPVLVVGGSWGMAGAAYFSAAGAAGAGSGYVRVACPECVYPILAGLLPTAVFVPLECDADRQVKGAEAGRVLEAAKLSKAAVVGPGLGEGTGAAALFESIVEAIRIPCVVDASALGFLSRRPELMERLPEGSVLTPHPGEMGGLLDMTAGQVQEAREETAVELARRTGRVVLLKGARTLVTDGEGVYENTSGNAGMASAGSGDVLSGVIAALVAQGLGVFEAACLGAYLHGKAGDAAAAELGRGLSASDIAVCVAGALKAADGRHFERGGRGEA